MIPALTPLLTSLLPLPLPPLPIPSSSPLLPPPPPLLLASPLPPLPPPAFRGGDCSSNGSDGALGSDEEGASSEGVDGVRTI